jgi:hypothetical protein
MKTRLFTVVAITLFGLSGVAHATIITETFGGTITSGIDNMGAFGAVGADLTGAALTFSFSYDTALLEYAIDNSVDGSYQLLSPSYYNLYYDYAGDSAFTESITINSQVLANTNSVAAPWPGAIEGCTAAQCGGTGGL